MWKSAPTDFETGAMTRRAKGKEQNAESSPARPGTSAFEQVASGEGIVSPVDQWAKATETAARGESGT
jgi:hypothetical protein